MLPRSGRSINAYTSTDNARESLFRMPKLLRDARFLRVAGQVLAVLLFVLVVILIWDNLTYTTCGSWVSVGI